MYTMYVYNNSTKFTCTFITAGALAVTLSSDPEVNATTVCPSTNVTFTCFVEQTSSMGWDVGGMEMKSFLSTDVDDIGRLFVVDNVFMVTLISISSVSNGLADLTITLMVTADEVENGTAITCRSFSDMQSISLVIASKFHFVSVYHTCSKCDLINSSRGDCSL